jgi:hypothetical protein
MVAPKIGKNPFAIHSRFQTVRFVQRMTYILKKIHFETLFSNFGVSISIRLDLRSEVLSRHIEGKWVLGYQTQFKIYFYRNS